MHTSKILKSNTTYGDSGGTNSTSATFAFSLGTGTGEAANAMLYLFNFLICCRALICYIIFLS